MNAMQKTSQDMKDLTSRYVKYGLGIGALSAAIGLIVSRRRAEKAKAKADNIEELRSAIFVPISKRNFMSELPKPKEQAELSSASPKALAGPDQKELSPEGIDAAKKEILKRNGAKFDFFRKAASDSEGEKENDAKADGAKDAKGSEEAKKDEKTSESFGELPRNAQGQFVSPTDPTGVIKAKEEVVKEAWYTSGDIASSIKNLVAHPIDTASGVLASAVSRPAAMVAGSLASLYVATAIVDAVNRRRGKKAKENAELARDEYVKLLQEGEKTAEIKPGFSDSENIFSGMGTAAGLALMVPGVITAIVANKILENRRRDKEDAKKRTDSFPDEPHILYKTSEDKSVEITPETALAVMAVKSAMIENMELAETDPQLTKKAQAGYLQMLGNPLFRKMIRHYDLNGGTFTDEGWKMLGSEESSDGLYKLISGQVSNIGKPGAEVFDSRIRKVLSDPRMTDILVRNFSNPGYKDTWGKLQNQLVDSELKKRLGDGLFFKIVSWLARTTGLGGWMFRRGLKKKLQGMNGGTAAPVAPAASGTAGASPASVTPVGSSAAEPKTAPSAISNSVKEIDESPSAALPQKGV